MKKLLLIIPFVCIAQWSMACSCEEFSFEEELKITEYIFVGQVISKKPLNPDNIGMFSYYEYEVQVNYYYKGKSTQKIIKVKSGADGSDCGFHFKVGQSYVIWGSFDQTKTWIRTGICDRTSKLSSKSVSKLDKRFTKRFP